MDRDDPRLSDRLPDGKALVKVTDSGTLWLIEPDQLGVVAPSFGDEYAPHEIPGPLPPLMQRRVDSAFEPRCGRPWPDGHRCATKVVRAGDACQHHRGGEA